MDNIATRPLHLMETCELAQYWATEFVDQGKLTLTELEQVKKNNLQLIQQFPRLQEAYRVWQELQSRKERESRSAAPKLIL